MNPSAVLLACWLVGIPAAAQAPSQPSSLGTPRADAPPRSLSELGPAAAAVFDDARDGRWAEAQSEVDGVETLLHQLPTGLGPPDLLQRLGRSARLLAQSVRRHDRFHAMDWANSLTRIGADLSRTFEVTEPIEVPLMAYYGRQLEIDVAAPRRDHLRQTKADLVQTWDALRPQLERRGDVDDVRRVSDLVVSIEGTGSREEIDRLARSEVAAIARIQKVFYQ